MGDGASIVTAFRGVDWVKCRLSVYIQKTGKVRGKREQAGKVVEDGKRNWSVCQSVWLEKARESGVGAILLPCY